jgi:flagellar biosynthesis chaperone FliJ
MSTFRLQSLLDLRRNAETEHKRLYAEAAFRRAAAERQLTELENKWVVAKKKLAEQQVRQREQSSPNHISEGLVRVRYLDRLSLLVLQAQVAARTFREGAMAKAITEEEAARLAYCETRKELEVVLKLEERELKLKKGATLNERKRLSKNVRKRCSRKRIQP